MLKEGILEYTYLQDNIKEIGIIKENEKVRIAKVEYMDNACVYKIYYRRNLKDVYEKIKECEITRNLTHIYEVVYYDGNTYIIEERLSGENLSEYIDNKGYMKEELFLHVVREVCAALSVLHKNSPIILHRDIKPSNIMLLNDGGVKLFDYDAARSVSGDKENDTVLLGTKGYAPPEQFGFCETGVYSDIYSLGMTMYELLTGKMLETSINSRIYECADKYKHIIEKCVEFDISKRYASVDELLYDLYKDNQVSLINGFDKFRTTLYDNMINHSLDNDLKRFTYENDLRYEKKIRQISKKVKKLCNNEVVLLIYDDTLSGNGKAGMVLTNLRIINIEMNSSVRLEEVEEITALEKTYIIVKSKNIQIKIPCTGRYELRKVLADALRRLIKL